MAAMEIWAVCDGGAGFAAQARGLARAVATLCGGEVVEKTVAPTAAFALLPGAVFARRWLTFAALHGAPAIAIVTGTRAAAVGIALRARGAFVVFVQKPPFAARYFDVVVAPMHDRLRGDNVVVTLGAVGEVTADSVPARAASAQRKFAAIPQPRVGALIGGGNRAFDFSPTDAQRLADELTAAANTVGGGILATASRRTGAAQADRLAQHLRGDGVFFWRGGDDNPYRDILAAADFFLVSGDSVNMLSEACATAKPVFIWLPPRRRGAKRAAAKFLAFHASLIARGLARPWRGEWATGDALNNAPGLAETARAAEQIWARFNTVSGARR